MKRHSNNADRSVSRAVGSGSWMRESRSRREPFSKRASLISRSTRMVRNVDSGDLVLLVPAASNVTIGRTSKIEAARERKSRLNQLRR